MFKVNNKNTRTTSLTSTNDVKSFYSVSFVDFKQVNVSWVNSWFRQCSVNPCLHLSLQLIASCVTSIVPVGMYLFKVNYRDNRRRCEICSKVKIRSTERNHRGRSGIFIVNSNLFYTFASVSVEFQHALFAGLITFQILLKFASQKIVWESEP